MSGRCRVIGTPCRSAVPALWSARRTGKEEHPYSAASSLTVAPRSYLERKTTRSKSIFFLPPIVPPPARLGEKPKLVVLGQVVVAVFATALLTGPVGQVESPSSAASGGGPSSSNTR